MPKEIFVDGDKLWDPINRVFITVKPCVLKLEHSLLSISLWESKWKVNYLDNQNLTDEQAIDYIRCMTINKNVDPNVYKLIANRVDVVKEILDYIHDSMTATFFRKDENEKKGRKRILTNELIYCWMFECKIPIECERWHINRLLTLIQVCNEENKPPKQKNKKRSKADRRAEMAKRRSKMGM